MYAYLKNIDLSQFQPSKSSVGFILSIGYLTYINIFAMKVSPELIVLQFFLLIIIFKRGQRIQFVKDWLPYIGFFFLFELLRGIVDDFSPFYDHTLYAIHFIEEAMFGGILPTAYLQSTALFNNVITLYILLIFYSSFFYYSFVVGFVIWYKKYADFHLYFSQFTLISFIGLAFYFLIPTSPPWLSNNVFRLDIERQLYDGTVLHNFAQGSFMYYFIKGNLVAAFPSLHTAWTAFTSLFIIKHYGKVGGYLLIIPSMVSLSVIVTGEHYVLDVIYGWILAYVVVNRCNFLLKKPKPH